MTVGTSESAQLRDALADRLLDEGKITSALVDRAVRTVPRHQFVPADTALKDAYDPYHSPVVKKDKHGVIVSSVSAPFIQTSMIEQAELQPGMRVLEIGSGGYNAALCAEVVGAAGQVVSVDIDEDVTDRARAALEAAGYGDRVTVVLADADDGIGDRGPFDAVIVTAGAWDISPTWRRLLTGSGRLVVPLRLNGITRVIAFQRQDDHLVSGSAFVAGFVPMQGTGEYRDRVFHLPDGCGHTVTLQFDDQVPDTIDLLDGVLAGERIELGSAVTLGYGEPFDDLALWFACHLPGFCRVTAGAGADLGERWFSFGVVRGDSFAYLAVRTIEEADGLEFAARGYGGEEAAAAMVEQIQAWDRQARHGDAPTFGYWPAGSDPGPLPAGTAALTKLHGTVTISWPG